MVEGTLPFILPKHKAVTMHQFKLTNHCLFRDDLPFRYRAEGQDLRGFLMVLLDEFYVGEAYRFKVVDDLGLACLATTAVCVYHGKGWHATSPEKRALVFATHQGSQFTDQEYQTSLDERRRASPRVFVQTLPNMAAGQVAACFGIRGEYFVLVQDSPEAMTLENTAALTLKYGGATLCLVGWTEYTIDQELTVKMAVRYASEKDQDVGSLGSAVIARS